MARHFNYYDDWETAVLTCPVCGWKGTFDEGSVESHEVLMDSSCPRCSWPDAPMLAIVKYPTMDESLANWEKLPREEQEALKTVLGRQASLEASRILDRNRLPEIRKKSFVLTWDFEEGESGAETLILYGDTVIYREPAIFEGYERFIEVAEMLREHYGPALLDLEPADRSGLYLYGDRLSSVGKVEEARKRIFACGRKGSR